MPYFRSPGDIPPAQALQPKPDEMWCCAAGAGQRPVPLRGRRGGGAVGQVAVLGGPRGQGGAQRAAAALAGCAEAACLRKRSGEHLVPLGGLSAGSLAFSVAFGGGKGTAVLPSSVGYFFSPGKKGGGNYGSSDTACECNNLNTFLGLSNRKKKLT